MALLGMAGLGAPSSSFALGLLPLAAPLGACLEAAFGGSFTRAISDRGGLIVRGAAAVGLMAPRWSPDQPRPRAPMLTRSR